MVQNITRDNDWSDLDLNFGLHPGTNDVSKVKGPQAVGRAIRNLVLMHFYDKPFNPQIGSNATKLLFENINPLTAIHLQNAIEEVIINFEPRASIMGVNVKQVPDENGYSAEIIYTVKNLMNPIRTTLFLERIR